jgi:hypothetical protein
VPEPDVVSPVSVSVSVSVPVLPSVVSLVVGGGSGSQPSGKHGSSHVVLPLVIPVVAVSLVSGGGSGSQPSGKHGSSHVVDPLPSDVALPSSGSLTLGPHATGAAAVTAAPAIDAARIMRRR